MPGTNWDSDEDDDFEDDAPKNQNAPKGLRAHAKKLEAENAEFRKQLEELQAASRKTALQDAIKAKKLNPKIAALVPKDVATEKLDEWLTEYGEVFGTTEVADQRTPEEIEEEADYGRISQASGGGEPPSKAGDLFGALADKNLTQAKLLEMIEAAGGGYGRG